MITIAILFALAVIGAAAPAASVGPDLLLTAVLLFVCALAGLLAACLASGWLRSERRTLSHMAGKSPVRGSASAVQTTPARTWSASVPLEPWTTRPLQANGSRPPAWHAAAASDRESLGTAGGRKRVMLAGLALPTTPAQPSRSRVGST